MAALASIALYQNRVLDPVTGKPDPALGYVRLMSDVLPSGMLGILLAGFLAAYMSTISTHLNWGSSYLIHDFYRRFIAPRAEEERALFFSRWTILLLAVISLWVAYTMDRITRGWEILMLLGAGTGPVYILRWYWWRVNAWSEISAMLGALGISLGMRYLLGWESETPRGFAVHLTVTVCATTLFWLLATLLTPSESEEHLKRFYQRTRPAGPGWNRIREKLELPQVFVSPDSLGTLFLRWISGCLFVYAGLFGSGAFLFGKHVQGVLWLAAGTLSLLWLWRSLSRGQRS